MFLPGTLLAITIKCGDCGNTKQSADGQEEACPRCEGTMIEPPKKKYQAKPTALEEESRANKKPSKDAGEKPTKKPQPRDDDEDDDEEEKPKAKKKPSRDEDDDGDENLTAKKKDEDDEDEKPRAKKKSIRDDADEDDEPQYTTDGKAAKQLGLDPGFKNRALMKQVAKELEYNETLHYVCRPSEAIAKKHGLMAALGGLVTALVGVGLVIAFLTALKDKAPTLAIIVPILFILIGGALAVLGPIMTKRQARLGWYAVTHQRAIVFHVNLWGKAGKVTTYRPYELRNMWTRDSFWLKGGGDLVFKTIVRQHTTTTRDAHGRRHTSTSTSKEHFGFLGIEDVKDVEALLHEVLLSNKRDDDDDDDDD